MATIANGYGNKPTHITLDTSDGIARLNIEQMGLLPSGMDVTSGSIHDSHSETMAYTNIQELISLRDEINKAIKELAGV